MSAKATFWAWHQRIKPASAKLVLLCLADCHNGDSGQCNPSVPYIARMTGLDRKTVITGIASLRGSGFIEVRRNAGSSTQYSILTSPDIGTTENGTSPENGSTNIPTKQYRKRDGGTPENGTQTYKESKKNLVTRFKPPTLDDVVAYCEGRSSSVDPGHFYDHHMACGWKLSNGNQIKDWMAVVRNWERMRKKWSGDSDQTQEHVF